MPSPEECRRLLSVLLTTAALMPCGAGCIYVAGNSSTIGLLAPASPPPGIHILQREVEGSDCPGGPTYGDYAKAIERAIQSVPDANVLTNVKLYSKENFSLTGIGICVRAVGDAGVLP